ncbi:hypothetical protein BU25DRAFT_189330 [Macroventuria anomochaeta]|uniref:Uncharacterized protein n=1 Tax=Macroventuria anomochaeta TaxID=301207 RepID=A0ACB6SCZ7_9PLEO|nr:uncharacterized protein BU25DRAFT_189330 [Macroventuria anomochaeta]KAF2631480.1 hypothetical protein BU25DRAFT_189330 [Macroventuria anomochaeta]
MRMLLIQQSCVNRSCEVAPCWRVVAALYICHLTACCSSGEASKPTPAPVSCLALRPWPPSCRLCWESKMRNLNNYHSNRSRTVSDSLLCIRLERNNTRLSQLSLRSLLSCLSLQSAILKLRTLHGFNTDHTSERHVRLAQQPQGHPSAAPSSLQVG